ncbi:hypothetical protein Tco_1482900 [Tanacetum coccineum]
MKTLVSSDTKLTKDEECESVDSTKYRGMIENTNKSWPLDCLGAQGLKSKPLIDLWELGLPPWTRPCGGWGLVMVMVLECCGEVNEVDIDRMWGCGVWRETCWEDVQYFKNSCEFVGLSSMVPHGTDTPYLLDGYGVLDTVYWSSE